MPRAEPLADTSRHPPGPVAFLHAVKGNHFSFITRKQTTDNIPGNELGGPQGRSSQKGNDKI